MFPPETSDQKREILNVLTKAGAKVQTMPVLTEWCGFSCDIAFGVVGKMKAFSSSLGTFESSSGALVTLDPVEVLKSVVTSSGVPVSTKKYGKKL